MEDLGKDNLGYSGENDISNYKFKHDTDKKHKELQHTSITENFLEYCKSPRGRALSMGISLTYAMFMTIIAFAILLSKYLPAAIIDKVQLVQFIIVMLSTSTALLFILLFMASWDKHSLTTDDHFKCQKSTSFLRAGVLALGSGGLIYYLCCILMYFHLTSDCMDYLELFLNISGVGHFSMQIAFLVKFSQIRINASMGSCMFSRFAIMHIIASNLILWLKIVVVETVNEIDNTGSFAPNKGVLPYQASTISYAKTTQQALLICPSSNEIALVKIISHYLYPLMIEFCVLASTMLLGIWERIGLREDNLEGVKQRSASGTSSFINSNNCVEIIINEADTSEVGQRNNRRNRSYPSFNSDANIHEIFKSIYDDESELGIRSESFPEYEEQLKHPRMLCSDIDSLGSRGTQLYKPPGLKTNLFYNSNTGFLLGWFVVIVTTVIVIACLYESYRNEGYDEIVEKTTYAANCIIHIMIMICIPITMHRMSVLTFKDDEIKTMRKKSKDKNKKHTFGVHKNLDKNLMSHTYLAMMTFKVMSCIASYEQAPDHWIIFTDGVVSIISSYMQLMFINWYAFSKRTTTVYQRTHKPGRQGLEFLRCANFALWFVNTFLLQHPNSKAMQETSFGAEPWVIISNILQPVVILFHFHAMICIAEIIINSYTTKYIGVVRQKKRVTRKKSLGLDKNMELMRRISRSSYLTVT